DQPERDREHRGECLRDQKHLAAVEPIDDRTAPQAEQQHWKEPERERTTDGDTPFLWAPDEPRLRHRLPPRPHVGDAAAGEVEAVVVRVERTEHSPGAGYRADPILRWFVGRQHGPTTLVPRGSRPSEFSATDQAP